MKNILFICAGNVARSQMAEAYFNMLTKSHKAKSAGVLKHTPKKFVHPIAEVVTVMKQDGIDVSNKIVKLVSKSMIDEADFVYILCPEEKIPDFVLVEGKYEFWNIKDPYSGEIEEYFQVRDQIKAKVESLIKTNGKF